MSFTGIGFDLDGTLIRSTRERSDILSEVSSVHGIDELSRREYIETHRSCELSEDRTPIFRELLNSTSSDVDPSKVAATYRTLIAESIVTVGGVRELFEQLRSDYEIGLLTNGPHIAQEQKIDELDLKREFDTILIEGEIGVGKPNEDAFGTLCDSLDASAANVVYIGNEIEPDIVGAKNAGLTVIQVCAPDQPDSHPKSDATVDRQNLKQGVLDKLDSL